MSRQSAIRRASAASLAVQQLPTGCATDADCPTAGPGTCARCQDGYCSIGALSPQGVCHVNASDKLNINQMANTYTFTSISPSVGVAMGGCDVKAIGSGISNFASFTPSCAAKGSAQYGRDIDFIPASSHYGPNYSLGVVGDPSFSNCRSG